MCSCPKTVKFEIMEKIIKNMVFKNEKMRQSFMQEILNAADTASYRRALEDKINIKTDDKFRTVKEYYLEFKKTTTRGTPYERIMELSEVDMNLAIHDQIKKEIQPIPWDPNFVPRLFILTNNGI